MKKYIGKQLVGGILSLLIFLTLVFFMAQILMPYDFTVNFILSVTPEERAQIQKELGLHLPLWKRYLNWVSRLIQGDLGTDFFGGSVTARMKNLFPPTLLVFGLGSVAAFGLGKRLGSIAGWRNDSWISRIVTGGAVTLNTIFPPWFAAVAVFYLARPLYAFVGWLGFRRSRILQTDFLNPDIWGSTKTPDGLASFVPPAIIMRHMVLSICILGAGLILLNWVVRKLWRVKIPSWANVFALISSWAASWFVFGYGMKAIDIILIAIRPLLAYVLLTFGDTMIIMRSSMQDTVHEDYITTAQAKGLSENTIREKHAARNAILPAISRFVINLPYLFTGAVIIERVTIWPGVGGALFGSLYNMNIPLLMGGLVVVGLITLLAQLALEIIQATIDPRILERIHQN